MSELVYAGKTLVEIAGLDDVQMQQVFFRPRDKYGRLLGAAQKKKKRKRFKAVTFEEMFRAVKRSQSHKMLGKVFNGEVFSGWTEEDIERMWQEYLVQEPTLAAKLEERDAVLDMMGGVYANYKRRPASSSGNSTG